MARSCPSPCSRMRGPRACCRPERPELDALRDAKPAFEKAWERWDTSRDDSDALDQYRQARDAWVDVILRKVLGWKNFYVAPTSIAEIHPHDRSVTVHPNGALVRGDIDRGAGLRRRSR